jgi:hypothetical protein
VGVENSGRVSFAVISFELKTATEQFVGCETRKTADFRKRTKNMPETEQILKKGCNFQNPFRKQGIFEILQKSRSRYAVSPCVKRRPTYVRRP